MTWTGHLDLCFVVREKTNTGSSSSTKGSQTWQQLADLRIEAQSCRETASQWSSGVICDIQIKSAINLHYSYHHNIQSHNSHVIAPCQKQSLAFREGVSFRTSDQRLMSPALPTTPESSVIKCEVKDVDTGNHDFYTESKCASDTCFLCVNLSLECHNWNVCP